MYKNFKKILLKEMSIQRDLIVLKHSHQEIDQLFEITTEHDNIYNLILTKFKFLTIHHAIKLLADLCIKHKISATMEPTCHNQYFDLLIELNSKKFFIKLRTNPNASNSSSRHALTENVKNVKNDVILIYLMKDTSRNRERLNKNIIVFKEKYNLNNLKIMLFEEFIESHFGELELKDFKKEMSTFKEEMHQVIGYQITEIFTANNLLKLKSDIEEYILTFNYQNKKESKYMEIKSRNPDFKDLNNSNLNRIKDNYLNKNRFKLLISDSDFSKSLLTSEWLFRKYFSLDELDNTFIVAGYLKSIEQLLWDIIKIKGFGRKIKGIEITENNENYIDKTLGSLQYFITNFENSDLFDSIFGNLSNKLYVMRYLKIQLSKWRSDYRNGYFHKHNLNDINIIGAIREETFYLYMLILGTISLDDDDLLLLSY